MQRLNQEAGKALAAGRAMRLALTEDHALAWITANPAWALGVLERTGTIEVGKMADLVLWSKHPLSVYARAEKVFVDGHLVFDRSRPAPRTDFEVGILGEAAP
jgi:imidazolonepropionase-like amidohydrolase